MNAGRELDALVAEKVMGWQWFPSSVNSEQLVLVPDQGAVLLVRWGQMVTELVPPYSTEIAAAWEVLERLRQPDYYEPSDGPWGRFIDNLNYNYKHSISRLMFDLSPFVICHAALKSVGVDTVVKTK